MTVVVGRGADPEVARALAAYMSGVADREWRSRSDLRAAVEAILDYRVEVDEVTRVIRALLASSDLEDRRVDLSPMDHDLYRIEYRRVRGRSLHDAASALFGRTS